MISVVIATKDHPEVLARTLAGLAAQADPPPFEAIVADDGDMDRTRPVVAAFTASLSLRHLSTGGRGRAGARNAGVREAAFPVVLFLDDDTIPQPGLLGAHAGRHVRMRAMVQGRVVTHREVPRARTARLREPLLRIEPRAGRRISPLRTATNLSAPADAVREAGGFDEGFTGYGWEDRELAYRLHARGLPVIWEPDAVAEHLQVDDLPAVLAKRRADGVGAVRFWRTHGRRSGLALALEIHPALLAWKRAYYSPPMVRVFRAAYRAAARRGLDVLAAEAASNLAWAAYYDGVLDALRLAPSAETARG